MVPLEEEVVVKVCLGPVGVVFFGGGVSFLVEAEEEVPLALVEA